MRSNEDRAVFEAEEAMLEFKVRFEYRWDHRLALATLERLSLRHQFDSWGTLNAATSKDGLAMCVASYLCTMHSDYPVAVHAGLALKEELKLGYKKRNLERKIRKKREQRKDTGR